MNKKYYTPELSEFHVGFECEIRGNKNDEFAKAVVSLYSIYTMDASRPLTTLMAYPIDKTNNMVGIHVFESELDGFVRVKCLDEEDVLALGWTTKIQDGKYYYKTETTEWQMHLDAYHSPDGISNGVSIFYDRGSIDTINALMKQEVKIIL